MNRQEFNQVQRRGISGLSTTPIFNVEHSDQ